MTTIFTIRWSACLAPGPRQESRTSSPTWSVRTTTCSTEGPARSSFSFGTTGHYMAGRDRVVSERGAEAAQSDRGHADRRRRRARPAIEFERGFCTMFAMRRALVLLLPVVLACAEQLPEHVDLQPAAEDVDIAMEPPRKNTFALIGKVTGIAAANDLDSAQSAARNDLRNKAAALGASLVTIDENVGEALPLQDKTKVKLVGRAYKSVD